jgi:hypothetical protein
VKVAGAPTPNGQIGDGTILPRLVPTLVTGLPGQPMYLDLGDEAQLRGDAKRHQPRGLVLGRQLARSARQRPSCLDSWVPVRAGTIANAWMVLRGCEPHLRHDHCGPVFCWGHSLLGQVGQQRGVLRRVVAAASGGHQQRGVVGALRVR